MGEESLLIHPPPEAVVSEKPYQWENNQYPFNFVVGREPSNPIQTEIFKELRSRLEEGTVGCQLVSTPDQETTLGSHAPMVMVFADGTLESIIRPSEVYLGLPEPRGMPLMINTVRELPSGIDFRFARDQLVRKAANNGVIVEENFERALWISMQGNWMIVTGTPEQVLTNITERILTHYGVPMLNQKQDDESADFTWEDWAASGVHADISEAAKRLGEAGIIQDKVNLAKYADPLQARLIMTALNMSGEFGESMRSQRALANVIAFTNSGAGKVKVNPNPKEGHLIPVTQLTEDGYIVAHPAGSPVNDRFKPSVETHENGLIYLAGALTQAGEVENFDQFLRYVENGFRDKGRIAIFPDGLASKVEYVDHFHGRPLDYNPVKVVLVEPDFQRFPRLDFPCGSLPAARMAVGALLNLKLFRDPGPSETPLWGKVIVVSLPGHGSIAICDKSLSREEFTDILLKEMTIVAPEQV